MPQHRDPDNLKRASQQAVTLASWLRECILPAARALGHPAQIFTRPKLPAQQFRYLPRIVGPQKNADFQSARDLHSP